MERIAFKMTLLKGFEEEYKKRHDAIWPELVLLLKEAGIEDYSIFLDEETLELFAVLKLKRPDELDSLKQKHIMKKWWEHMKDIMEINPDNSPVTKSLKEVFYMS